MARSLASDVQAVQVGGSLRAFWSQLLARLAAALYLSVALLILWEIVAVLSGPAMSLVPALEEVLGVVCHHQSERTLSVDQTSFPVCARCAGIWFGWLSAAPLWFWAHRRSGQWNAGAKQTAVTVLALFTAATVLAILETAGTFSSSNLARLGLGVPLGLGAGVALLLSSSCSTRRDS